MIHKYGFYFVTITRIVRYMIHLKKIQKLNFIFKTDGRLRFQKIDEHDSFLTVFIDLNFIFAFESTFS